jgi:hypothetical protein
MTPPKTFKVGDMTIRVRDWPLPNVEKCLYEGKGPLDRWLSMNIAVIGDTGQLQLYYAAEHGWDSRTGYGYLREPPKEHPFWFWPYDAIPLVWTEVEREAGMRVWKSGLGLWKITQTVPVSYPQVYFVAGPLSFGPCSSLQEAQQTAASMHRDWSTR